ncbi:unnamed protein product [Linum tenue]|uniref:Cytochrome P450 n=1 Tax=Linum tenue TaxID=586396 RepID=A0AAV0LGX2_9ROSI|nr:unnamed protein product [Linum tenue]
MISCFSSSDTLPFQLITLATILLVVTLFILIKQKKLSKTAAAALNLPPGPKKLPIIGNIHQMPGDLPHRRLRDLAGKHGPDVMSLQLGELSYIVISTPEAAKVTDKLFYGRKGIGFAPYGDHWRQMRKLCTLELFSARRVQSFRRIREEAVANLVASLTAAAAGETSVDLTRMASTVTSAITTRAAFGKAQELTDAANFMVVVDNISDLLGGFSGLKAKLEKMSKASDSVLDQIIDEHKSRRTRAATTKDDRHGSYKEDLVDVLLNLQEKQVDLGAPPITMEVVKAITLELFLAGIETSATTIEWTMSEMINNSRVLQMAQEEVRQVYGDDGQNHIDEASLDQLNYLDMVIAESLRLHPPGPLLLPRENGNQKVELSSYEVPINTKVIVNVWAINRDPRYWKEAERFLPERFMDYSIDYKGTDFQFIPFGAGRRMCPGVSFGMAIVKLTLANLLFHFDWVLPAGQKSIDMTECFGMTLRKQYALHLIPVSYNRVPFE